MENALFRIAQEALTNVVKHAEAHSVVVTIDFTGGTKLVVADDGHGFPSAASPAGIGVEGMRDRATANGGELALSSGPTGVSVSAAFPIIGP